MIEEVKSPALKSCPFCGGPGEIVPPAEVPEYWYVGCKNAQCPMDLGMTETTKEKALTAWNTRADDQAVKELREENERLRAFAQSFRVSCIDASIYKDCYLHLIKPNSLTLRLSNGSDKSWLFADLEQRRQEALASTAKWEEK